MTPNHIRLALGGAILFGAILLAARGTQAMDDEVPTRKPLAVYAIPDGHLAQAAVFLPNGNEVVIDTIRRAKMEGEGHLHFFDCKSDKLVRSIERPSRVANNMVFVDGGKKLVAAGWDDKFRVYGGDGWKEIETFERVAGDDSARCLATDASGKWLASAHYGYKGPRLWDMAKKTAVKFPGDADTIGSVALSPDGKELAIAYDARRVEVFDTATVKRTATLTLDGGIPKGIRYSPDGKKLVAGWCGENQLDGQIRVWDVATRKLLHSSGGAPDIVQMLAVTPDSKYTLTYTGPGRTAPGIGHVSVWSLDSGKLVERFETGVYGNRFALSPDGKVLVTVGSDGTAHKWDFAAIRKEFEAKMEKK